MGLVFIYPLGMVDFFLRKLVDKYTTENLSHTIHVWYIYIYLPTIWLIFCSAHFGTSTSPPRILFGSGVWMDGFVGTKSGAPDLPDLPV